MLDSHGKAGRAGPAFFFPPIRPRLPGQRGGDSVRPMNTSDNPLLRAAGSGLPDFAGIRPEHVLPALEQVLADSRSEIEQLARQKRPDWVSLMWPLEAVEERLHRIWSPVCHLNAVCDSDTLRPVYEKGMMRISAWQTEMAQHEGLYAAIRTLRKSDGFASLSGERQRAVEHTLRDFRLAGADLQAGDKQRFRDIQMRLAELGTRFEQHVLDATRAFCLHVTDRTALAGLPDSVLESAAQLADRQKKSGWVFTLDAPSYVPFMQYAENRMLRKRMYTAYVTRASNGEFDNAPVIKEILCLRAEAARLLGFANYGEYSLATKAAGTPREVTDFLRELAARSRPVARRELNGLRAFAATHLGLKQLEAWDIAFASERLRRHSFDFSQEDLRPYFPEHQVLKGLFQVAGRLYGLHFRERTDVPTWHENVRYFDILDSTGRQVAGFYLDPYARPHKCAGAWMDECIIRWRRPDGMLQRPVAYLVCNFAAPVGDAPALWTHEEVITLFHEFGHGLHHMLTRVETLNVSGIRGVPWDAVELPSQFMENFCWEHEVLAGFARHHETGEPLPPGLFDKMRAAKNFQAGMQMLRQVEFALFDFLLHTEFDPDGAQGVQGLLDTVRREVAVLTPPAFNRFQNSFSHIFAGGYAAGYYGYKWAEVLSADAYAAFEEAGVFDPETARAFHENILAIGGSRDIMKAFEAFRGRAPELDALLERCGLQ